MRQLTFKTYPYTPKYMRMYTHWDLYTHRHAYMFAYTRKCLHTYCLNSRDCRKASWKAAEGSCLDATGNGRVDRERRAGWSSSGARRDTPSNAQHTTITVPSTPMANISSFISIMRHHHRHHQHCLGLHRRRHLSL